MISLQQVLWFLVAVSLLVTVHEFGHYWVARKLGFKVLRFSVGFGKALYSRVAGADRTEYVIAMLPLGGYVKLLDEREGPVPNNELHRSFTRKAPWQRILVLLAGPAMNIVFAILVLWGVFAFVGEPDVKAVVGPVTADSIVARAGLRRGDEIVDIDGRRISGRSDVVLALVDSMSGSGDIAMTVRGAQGSTRDVTVRVTDTELRRRLTEPTGLYRGLGFHWWSPPQPAMLGEVVPLGPAGRAGLRSGDLITRVDGEQVSSFEDLVDVVSARPSRTVVVEYRRAGSDASVTLTTDSELADGHDVGRIRVGQSPQTRVALPENMLTRRTYGPIEALGAAAVRAYDMTALQARMFWRMVRGQVSLKNLSGPLSIAEFAGESARAGLSSFLNFLVLISLSLGFLNLLPIPILDGGQIVFQCIEWLKGSPLSQRAQIVGQQIGIALLLLLMGVALFNDVSRQFG